MPGYNKFGSKLIASFLILSFSFLQIPYLHAENEPVDLPMGVPVPTIPVDQPNTTSDSNQVKPNTTSEDFLANTLALTVVGDTPCPDDDAKCDERDAAHLQPRSRPLPIPVEVPQIKLIKEDLVNTFGFKPEDLENLINEGLIKFVWQPGYKTLGDIGSAWNLAPIMNNMVTAAIDPSVKPSSGVTNLTNPLGPKDLPNKIQYKFSGDGHILSAHFTNNEGQLVDVSYADDLISVIKISVMKWSVGDVNHDGITDTGDLAFIKKNKIDLNGDGVSNQADIDLWKIHLNEKAEKVLVKELKYTFGANSLQGDFNGDGVVDAADYIVWRKYGGTLEEYNAWRANFGNVQTEIIYQGKPQDDVTSRTVYFDKFNQISQIAEFDKDGTLIAKNMFGQGGVFERFEARGNRISTVSVPPTEDNSLPITVTFIDGKVFEINGDNLTTEELLSQVLEIEKGYLPPLPAGWTRTNSNLNYAFQVQRLPSADPTLNHDVLALMDLKSGAILMADEFQADEIKQEPDVTSDGKYAVSSWFHLNSQTPAIRVFNIQEKTFIDSKMDPDRAFDIKLVNNQIQVTYADGTVEYLNPSEIKLAPVSLSVTYGRTVDGWAAWRDESLRISIDQDLNAQVLWSFNPHGFTYNQIYEATFDLKNSRIFIDGLRMDGNKFTAIITLTYVGLDFIFKSLEYRDSRTEGDTEVTGTFEMSKDGSVEHQSLTYDFKSKSSHYYIARHYDFERTGEYRKKTTLTETLWEDEQGLVYQEKLKSYEQVSQGVARIVFVFQYETRNMTPIFIALSGQTSRTNINGFSRPVDFMSTASVNGINLFEQINSVNDYKIIEDLAPTKRVNHYSPEVKDEFGRRVDYIIEYVKDAENNFVPKRAIEYEWRKTQGETRYFIIRGEPDILAKKSNPDDSKDILIKNPQEFNQAKISYGSHYNQSCNVFGCSDSYQDYGLIFDLPSFDQSGVWQDNQTFVVDYPNQQTLNINGKNYRINIDNEGNVTLQDIPVLDSIDTQTLSENAPFSLQLTATDLNNDSLTYYLMDLRNSSDPEGDIPEGANVDPQTGLFTWTPTLEQAGTYELTFGVSDGGWFDFKTVTFNVQNTNRPPAATEARYDVTPGNALDITLNGLDPDGNPIVNYEIVKFPLYGRLIIDPNNPAKVKYEPREGSSNYDSFYFKVYDGTSWSDVVKVGIDIANEPKQGNFHTLPIFKWITSQENSITGTIETTENALEDTYTMIVVDGPDHGTLTISSGSGYTYTPNPAYFGNDSFTFRAKNNRTGEVSSIAQGQILGLYGFNQTSVVIDTGIDYLHYALGGNFGSQVVGGWDFAENDSDPMDDTHGHGTHVAGIIGSTDLTYTGIAPLSDLAGLRVFDDQGYGSPVWLEQSLDWVINEVRNQRNGTSTIENPITTINMSLGFPTYLPSGIVPWQMTLEDELKELEELGVFISVAAGNAYYPGYQGVSYPASSPYVTPVMSVGGPSLWPQTEEDLLVNQNGLSFFSQRDPLAIAAPGWNIISTVPDTAELGGNRDGIHNDFRSLSGTSMASPFLAGASMLIREALEFLGNQTLMEEIQDLINEHMRNTADTIWDKTTQSDYLRLNLERAIDSLFHPEDYQLDFSYLINQGIRFGLNSIGGMISLTSNITDKVNALSSAVTSSFSKLDVTTDLITPSLLGSQLMPMVMAASITTQPINSKTETANPVSKVRLIDYSMRKISSIKVQEKYEDEVLKIKKQKQSKLTRKGVS